MRVVLVVLLLISFVGAGEASILIYDANAALHNGQAAVTSLGLSFTVAGAANFNTLLTGSTWDLVILDLPSTTPSGGFTNLIAYIGGGGKALMSFWDLQSEPLLAAAFEVSQVSSFNSPQNVSIWSASHPIFNSPNSISPLTSWSDNWGDDGDGVNPVGTAVALAGFTASPAADQAAIVLGNGGRTLYNGFLWDDFTGQNGVDLVANEVNSLLSDVPEPSTYVLVGAGLLALAGMRARRLRVRN